MPESPEIIIKGVVTGDAAGYTLNSLKKNHIRAVYREISGFTDPAPALKHGMNKWRKPGLYSSISQLMLLAGACIERRHFNSGRFIEAVKNAPELPDHEYSYFRDPGTAEKNFIINAGQTETGGYRFEYPCARILPVTIPMLLMKMNCEDTVLPVFTFVSMFTADISTALCSALLLQIIYRINADQAISLFEHAAESGAALVAYSEANSHLFFELGYNPDYVINDARFIHSILQKIFSSQGISSAEDIIITEVNKKISTPVTRASVNLPFAILPFALSIAGHTTRPQDIFLSAAAEGGASSALASIAGALACAKYGNCIPQNLDEGLINRKKIQLIISDIASGRNREQIIRELTSGELSLTKKENEEYQARNRKSAGKKSAGAEKKPVRREDTLSRHIVESWTKIDKARWKKEKNRSNNEPED